MDLYTIHLSYLAQTCCEGGRPELQTAYPEWTSPVIVYFKLCRNMISNMNKYCPNYVLLYDEVIQLL